MRVTVGELVGVDVAEAVLHVRVDDELGEAQDLTAEVEGVTWARVRDRVRVRVRMRVRPKPKA